MVTKVVMRKVLNVGGSYLITLPRDFMEDNHIKHGDKVIVTYDKICIVSPNEPEGKPEDE